MNGEKWLAVRQALDASGVRASANAIRQAKQLAWTPDHAAAVITKFGNCKKAWQPRQLYDRFSLPPTVPPDEGWPDPSKEWLAAETVRKKRVLEAAESKARCERAQAKAAEREAAGPASFGDLHKRLAENTEALKKERAVRN